MPKDLPILWWMDAKELGSKSVDPEKMQAISDAIARWEKDGSRSLDDLKQEVDDIINSRK